VTAILGLCCTQTRKTEQPDLARKKGLNIVTAALSDAGFSTMATRAKSRQCFTPNAASSQSAFEKIIPVGHDAGGPAAVNFALKHPQHAATVCLMNAFYGDAPGLRVPELIELFANKGLRSLTRHFLASPQEFAWLLAFQRDQMQVGLTEAQKARYHEFLGPIIDDNFRQRPGAGPAFAQMTYQYSDEVAANTARLADFRRSGVPLLLIWGMSDPYLHVTVAEYMRSQARNAAIHIQEAGHWPQIDEAADVARIMLASRNHC
jgi:pimeloyl-ACP methyl ester carboxylesterase